MTTSSQIRDSSRSFHIRALFVVILFLVVSPYVAAEDGVWSFAFFADSRSGNKANTGVNSRVLNLIAKEMARDIKDQTVKCELVLFGGDLIRGQFTGKTTQSNQAQFQEWKSAMTPVYKAFEEKKQVPIPLYVVRGNHEVYHNKKGTTEKTVLQDWMREFGNHLPQNGPPPPPIESGQTTSQKGLNYFVKYKGVLFVAVDQYVKSTYDPAINEEWLHETLQKQKAGPHVFVFGHAPAWPALRTGHDKSLFDYLELRDKFWKTIERSGCRVYLTGHQHYTSVTRIKTQGKPDMWQVISGSAGAPLTTGRPDILDRRQTLYVNNADFGYYLGEVDGDIITLKFKHYSESEKKWKSDKASVVKYRVQ